MTKAVFRPGEVALVNEKVILDPPYTLAELARLTSVEENNPEEIQLMEEYSGPTVEDLRREVEEFKKQWDTEREGMIRSAQTEAGHIIKDAEEAALREVEQKAEEARILKRDAEEEAERILAAAREKAAAIEADSHTAFENERKEAENQGRETGREAGFAEGYAEVERLIDRTRTVLERAQDKREEILAETEQQIIDLVLLISRKVVKVISENQRTVVISNVVQALRKVKGRGNIIIKVNLVDIKLTTEHTKKFIQLLEGAQSVQVVEDSSVDPGGCIIETDFGEVDARISSQFAELESKILEMSPIKVMAKAGSSALGV
ncbi:MAG: flagellar assembly protein FliH [Spirochaetaceae bacterium]|jgi:flagellar assembly protein FliH|nr:flagellar assembly protein FliH [Spirochaetaceae bacterium]